MSAGIRLADITRDAPAIAAIYEPFCLETAVTFDFDPPSPDSMAAKMHQLMGTHPWLVYEEDGHVVAYAYAAPHRARKAYQWSVEVSIYCAASHRGRGVGGRLYRELFAILRRLGYLNAYAGITLPNEASVAIHESFGFKLIGIYPHAGFKLGKWHDVGWWYMRLGELPEHPGQPMRIVDLP